ncbi:Nucleobase-ascorbate transporter 12 [Hibiscus syriacus]|uniref:Nucleobase-ascorbate transporter 12 n=1 Tax=Hibiscus syriacus TaxID=106335 RepID=A0A6A3CSW3_HIBSY|nr:Nucleobase-ascorbate transporter 12 [Hibiscus syriacus]
MSTSDPETRPKPSTVPPAPDATPIPPSSWAQRTGFKPKFSGKTNASDSGQIALPPRARENNDQPDLEAGGVRPAPPAENGKQPAINNGQPPQPPQPARRPSRNEEVVDVLPQNVGDEGFVGRHLHMKYELRDITGLVPIGLYGFQHYLSMLGSLILIPLVIVPAMGGTYEETANLVSTVLFVSGVTTLLHSYFGSRLPLIQGSSFVFLAPALAIINSPEFRGLDGNNFKHIMKELQGPIIIASDSGLMSLCLRLINPVVVAPTIASVGLSFYSYGFPIVGNCLEIGVIQMLLVPLGLLITWGVAFLLTEAGAYSYKGCDSNIPASNIISEHCRKHVSRMNHCRVDTSHAFKSSPWFRFPYPLQWGTPIFHWKMTIVMCVVSIIASVDSVGSYHASSLLVSSRPPTPGVVSRGIGLEGLSSILAGLWGTGTGSTTLTENVHTIAVTKMGSRRAVELGACVLIVLSLIGKVGGFIASIPEVMVAALLCFMWAMLTALGLSNLRYSEAGSSRNIIIVGLSLFFSLSIPAYFQQYGISPNSNLSVPSYFQPYIVTSHGPFRTKYEWVNYIMNTLLSLNMVIAFIVAVILDNTVPGSRLEWGVYIWSKSEAARRESAVVKDYELPFWVGRIFRWVKWVGL